MIATKQKKSFICTSCNQSYPVWRGKCLCGLWNTIQEVALAQKVYILPKQSKKTKLAIIENKLDENSENVQKEKWFAEVREKLTGFCQCGCGNISQKKDDLFFRSSCCHIFPKAKFFSVKFHTSNYVERAFFGGCHGVMDNTSINRWVGMADWDNIKEKFNILAPLLTNEEKATKFYTQLENIVKNN